METILWTLAGFAACFLLLAYRGRQKHRANVRLREELAAKRGPDSDMNAEENVQAVLRNARDGKVRRYVAQN